MKLSETKASLPLRKKVHILLEYAMFCIYILQNKKIYRAWREKCHFLNFFFSSNNSWNDRRYILRLFWLASTKQIPYTIDQLLTMIFSHIFFNVNWMKTWCSYIECKSCIWQKQDSFETNWLFCVNCSFWSHNNFCSFSDCFHFKWTIFLMQSVLQVKSKTSFKI